MATSVMQRVRGNRLLLLLALIFGLVSAAVIYVVLSQADEDGGPQPAAKLPVVVAAQDIPAGATIAPEMLKLSTLPQEALLPDVFRRTEDVVGKIAVVSLVMGEQVLPSKVAATSGPDLSRFGENPPLSLIVPEGMRALSIPVDQVSAAGGLVRPGDYVDVIYVVEDGLLVCTVVQDVQVLAIAQAVAVPTPEAVEGETGTVPEANPGAGTATLAVSPQQAVVVAGVMGAEGDLRLALRRLEDRGVVQGLPACQVTAVPTPAASEAIPGFSGTAP